VSVNTLVAFYDMVLLFSSVPDTMQLKGKRFSRYSQSLQTLGEFHTHFD
jgi:hypothetical protein